MRQAQYIEWLERFEYGVTEKGMFCACRKRLVECVGTKGQ